MPGFGYRDPDTGRWSGREVELARSVAEALRARAEGVPLIGYLCWTITSNREWGLPFGPSNDFGLYEVHLDTDPELRRIPTSSVATYQELIDRAR